MNSGVPSPEQVLPYVNNTDLTGFYPQRDKQDASKHVCGLKLSHSITVNFCKTSCSDVPSMAKFFSYQIGSILHSEV